MQTNLQKNLGIFMGIVVICAVPVISIVFDMQKSQNSVVPDSSTVNPDTPTPVSPTPVVPPEPAVPPTPVTNTPVDVIKKTTYLYKDGSYTATGSYNSPGGYDQLGVSLTLKDDKVTSVSVTPKAGDRTSTRYQEKFISGYKQYVIGKNIDSLHLGTISGSSLTPKGFNDALAQIKKQAQA